jgi:hypothetical protein
LRITVRALSSWGMHFRPAWQLPLNKCTECWEYILQMIRVGSPRIWSRDLYCRWKNIFCRPQLLKAGVMRWAFTKICRT